MIFYPFIAYENHLFCGGPFHFTFKHSDINSLITLHMCLINRYHIFNHDHSAHISCVID